MKSRWVPGPVNLNWGLGTVNLSWGLGAGNLNRGLTEIKFVTAVLKSGLWMILS